MSGAEEVDLIVIGAGAAGLATAIFASRAAPTLRVRCLDGARRVGAKILVSGGSRCNVTNSEVTEHDFWGGRSHLIRRVLRAFPATSAVEFFTALGVHLHEEEDGKLFPDSNRSQTVLDALLGEASRCGVVIATGERVIELERTAGRFTVVTAGGRCYGSRAAVLATGGRALPKSGSDGFGYELARRLGHGYVETTPALAPLVLGAGPAEASREESGGGGSPYAPLSGVSHPARLTVMADGQAAVRLDGSLLWTHFGISGPVALNASRHWHRARLQGAEAQVVLGALPGETFESIEAWLQSARDSRPRSRVATVLASRLPGAAADEWVRRAGIPADAIMAHLPRDSRRRLAHALAGTPLDVTGSRGYTFAEATAGGVPLEEIDAATMQSRVCSGLYLVGEILDVDGRLGGFNFQWAWSSGFVAGRAVAAAHR